MRYQSPKAPSFSKHVTVAGAGSAVRLRSEHHANLGQSLYGTYNTYAMAYCAALDLPATPNTP